MGEEELSLLSLKNEKIYICTTHTHIYMYMYVYAYLLGIPLIVASVWLRMHEVPWADADWVDVWGRENQIN